VLRERWTLRPAGYLELMARKEKSEGAARPPAMIVTSITVVDLPEPQRHSLRARRAGIAVPHGARRRVVLGAVLVLIGAVALAVLLSGRSPGAHRASTLGRSERAAIARALGYPYPLRCLTIAVSAADPNYATAELDRTGACAQYHGYIYGTLHRTRGAWRLLLDEGQLYIADRLLNGRLTAGPGGASYPLGCLSAETLVQDPAFAREGLDRGVCARP
jgi:hypothetical protein